jgi:hypothetical protein
MANNEIINDVAKQVLTVKTAAGANDSWLWDKAQRVLRNTEHISQLPEIVSKNVSVDKQALQAAVLFSDAGYVSLAEMRKKPLAQIIVDVNPADIVDFSVQVVSEKFEGKLPKDRIEKINTILYAHVDRLANMAEAMILSDAKNLEDMGMIGLFNEFRNSVASGKEISATLLSWKKKIDYRYWQVRLEESFRFKSVQQIAKRRFESAEEFIGRLATENSGRDIEEVILESLDQV